MERTSEIEDSSSKVLDRTQEWMNTPPKAVDSSPIQRKNPTNIVRQRG
jgi:hypothetical protein